MKKAILILSIIVTLFISSCSGLAPIYTEEPEIKHYVFINSINLEQRKSLTKDYVENIFLGGLGIEDMLTVTGQSRYKHIIGPVITLFYAITEDHWKGSTPEKLKENFWKVFNGIIDDRGQRYDHRLLFGRSNEKECELAEEICEKNIYDASNIFNSLIDDFFTYTESVACDQVKTIHWDYDLVNTGDTYDGYEVIYEVGRGYYTRISLIEFYGDTERWEAKILKKTSSLSNIHY